MIKEVGFEDIKWYRMLGKESNKMFLSMGNYLLKEYQILEVLPM